MNAKTETRAIALQYDLSHPPAKVRRALTDPALLALWVSPRCWREPPEERRLTKSSTSHAVQPIGWVRSALKRWADAPRQGYEGAPDARLQIEPAFRRGLEAIDGTPVIDIKPVLAQAGGG